MKLWKKLRNGIRNRKTAEKQKRYVRLDRNKPLETGICEINIIWTRWNGSNRKKILRKVINSIDGLTAGRTLSIDALKEKALPQRPPGFCETPHRCPCRISPECDFSTITSIAVFTFLFTLGRILVGGVRILSALGDERAQHSRHISNTRRDNNLSLLRASHCIQKLYRNTRCQNLIRFSFKPVK